jgi:hypothetical protein
MKDINESFEDFRLNEIGDGGSKPFKYILKTNIEKELDDGMGYAKSQGGDWGDDIDIIYIVRGDHANYKVNIACNIRPKIQPGHPRRRSKIIYKGELQCNIGFDEAGENQEATTNYNEQYRLMATISDIVVEFIKSIENTWFLTKAYVVPKADEGESESVDNRRGKFYEAYLRKQIRRLKNPYTINTETIWKGARKTEVFVLQNGHWSGGGGGKTGYIRND